MKLGSFMKYLGNSYTNQLKMIDLYNLTRYFINYSCLFSSIV